MQNWSVLGAEDWKTVAISLCCLDSVVQAAGV